MFSVEQVTANLDRALVSVTRALGQAADEYSLPMVKMLAERRDELLDSRLALRGR